MGMKNQRFLRISLGLLAAVVAAGSWYVFVEGAPQLDGPVDDSAVAGTADKLSYEIVGYRSKIFAGDRT